LAAVSLPAGAYQTTPFGFEARHHGGFFQAAVD
jgi:hypothetical protein